MVASIPDSSTPIILPVPPASLAHEIACLPPSCRLVEQGNLLVVLARARYIPCLLREVGRLREISFRAVGEGTGLEIDVDRFDQIYEHLIVFERQRNQVIGACRLGRTDEVLTHFGLQGLYTHTLFDFDPALFSRLGPSLEVGRAFVRQEYQRAYAPLLLLFRGVGVLLARCPRYRGLFGPVSISATYGTANQALIAQTAWAMVGDPTLERWVRPRNPMPMLGQVSSLPRDLDELSQRLEEYGGVPVLLKHYLKLDGRLLGFNVDPEFANCLDGLILVDVPSVDNRLIRRYFGSQVVEIYLAHHRQWKAALG
jgi:putative hemolysin